MGVTKVAPPCSLSCKNTWSLLPDLYNMHIAANDLLLPSHIGIPPLQAEPVQQHNQGGVQQHDQDHGVDLHSTGQ